MEGKIDALFEIVKDLTAEVGTFKTEMNSRFDTVDKRFEQVDERFDTVDKRFKQVDVRFNTVDKRFEQVDERFEQVDERFDTIDMRFEQVDGRFDTLELKVDNLSSESRSYFKRLEERSDTHDFVIRGLSHQIKGK